MSWLEAQQSCWLAAMYQTGPLPGGLSIYRRNFLGNHGAALAQTYPRTQQLLGDATFRYCAQMLLHRHPVRSGDLNDYGGEFAALLQDRLPAVPAQAPALAALEWATLSCMRAAEPPPGRLPGAEAIPTLAHRQLQLVPATRLLTLDAQLAALTTGPRQMAGAAHGLLLYRQQQALHVLELNTAEYRFLQPLAHGATLLVAIEQALAVDAEFLPQVLLQALLRQQLLMICGVDDHDNLG